MKRFIIVLSLVSLVLLIASSCKNDASGPRASLSIRIQDDTQRTIMPNATLMATQKYSISGSGPSGASFGPLIFGESIISINDIAVGTWNITAKALNAENNELSSGSATLQIRKGSNEGTIVLDTVPGYGNLQLDISWPTGISAKATFSIEVLLEDSSGHVVTKTTTARTSDGQCTIMASLSAGSHILNVKAKDSDGSVIAGATEAVRIVANTWSFGNVGLKASSTSTSSEQDMGGLSVVLENKVGTPMGYYIDYYPKNPTKGQLMTLQSKASDLPSGVDSSKLTFQWYKDGVAQKDGVGMNYIIVAEQGSHRYDVVVKSNMEGTMCSASVLLTL